MGSTTSSKSERIHPGAKAKLAKLNERIAELEEALGAAQSGGRTIEQWETSLPQKIRDGLAGRAVISYWGDPTHALRSLGFVFEPFSAEAKSLEERVLKTPGVVEYLDTYASTPDDVWALILARQREIALTGGDDASVRAASQLAKIEGRIKQPDVLPSAAPVVNLFNILGSGKEGRDMKTIEQAPDHSIEALLGHEPGAPTRITVKDQAVMDAIAQAEE